MDFWTHVSRIILKGRYFILILIAALTYFLASQMQYMRFSYTEANLLPQDHKINIEYNSFLDLFGEEGNLIILAVEDSTIFTPEKFNAWNILSKKLDSFNEVDFSVAVGDIKKLTKNSKVNKFDIVPLYDKTPKTKEDVLKIKHELFENLPFFDNFLFNKKTGTIRTVIYLEKDIVNTSIRKDFIFNSLNPIIEQFENNNNIDIRVSGMPYIRTMNAQNIIDEIGLFVGLALGVTALIFFFFFRSFRATFITYFYYAFSGKYWCCLGLWFYRAI
jgi:predicted RND superfamily exporter protein